ncbi:hypothetical protein PGT21_019017 [Puccinia graminis f. sp. tritici]|uniref:Zinc finger RING-type eukaryotic domain-containing protein n=1 Tax=Puccinia graminis f. sp. tritici TaxID=56615 RepID=A0A5B0P897_PUCGR|nr:hypothetical protein PGT21_019017 [Puccinia graminis f. sp. tritici]KAA1126018.1 hypothetical protein PGTUg99_011913 [Puccinia graminis f. sp. tritici]
MAEKRRQRSAESEETETQQKQVSKRVKNNNHNNNNTTTMNNSRPQHNQRMAQAALARIKKLEPNQKTITTTNITNSTNTPASASSSPQSSSSSSQTINPTNTQDNNPSQPTSLDNHPIHPTASADLHQQIKNLKDQIENINKTVSTYKDVVENQTNLIDSIKSSLSCNICLEVLDSPYALLCGHIFCHKDLYAWFHRTNPASDRYDSDSHDTEDDDDDDDSDSDSAIRFGHHLQEVRVVAHVSSDSEFNGFGMNRPGPSNRGAANGANIPQQANLAGLMNEADPGRNAHRTTLRPVSLQRRRRNLICPQCRAAVLRRPMPLYAVKEAADKLKTTGTPVPSSSCPTGSFRNLVEQHRDERDLTWGHLFEANNNQDHHLSNVRRDPDEGRHVVVDLEDGVRRCGRCAWEIGNSGICEGCGARYASLDTDDSDDESFQAPIDSEDMGTNYESEEERDEEEDGEMENQAAYFWSRPMGRVLPVDSGSDDGASMTRMVSGRGDSDDDSSDVQVVRRRRHVFPESDSDVEAQPSAAARRRVAEEQPRRPSSINEIFSSSPRSDRPHYSPSNNNDVDDDDRSMTGSTDEDHFSAPPRRSTYRTGIAIAHGRVISSDDGYSSTASRHGTPVHYSSTISTASSENDTSIHRSVSTPEISSDLSETRSDDHVSQSSTDPGKSDDDDGDDNQSARSSLLSSSDHHFISDDDDDQDDEDHGDDGDDPLSDSDSDSF